jgi:hypothetical protein
MSLPYLQPYLGLSNGLNTLHAAGGPGGAVGGWVELGRASAGAGVDDFSVSSLPDKRYYMILRSVVSQVDPSNYVRSFVRFNGDSGSNYAYRYSFDGANETTVTSNSNGLLLFGNTSVPDFGVGYIANYSSKEKLMIGHGVGQNIAGAANAPSVRWEMVGKWANTSNAINEIGLHNTEAGSFNTNDELVVLGWDPADSHTNNFWEELASVEQASPASSLSTGTFTAKKYLWIQMTMEQSVDSDFLLRFNSDSGGNYARRRSVNGGADVTGTGLNSLLMTSVATGGVNRMGFANLFIVNNQSKEKLVIGHSVHRYTADATGDPVRQEFVGKWANTSNQITSFSITSGSGNMTTNTRIKVWGAD